MAKISQTEARRLRRRVAALEQAERSRRYRYGSDWPGGELLWRFGVDKEIHEAVRVANALGHACVVKCDDATNGWLVLHALKHPAEPV